jgi:hypothetical protein
MDDGLFDPRSIRFLKQVCAGRFSLSALAVFLETVA